MLATVRMERLWSQLVGRLWGAERIRGELLKLGIKVSKRTIQKYMRSVRGRNGGGAPALATSLKNHAERICANRAPERREVDGGWWIIGSEE